MQSTRLSIYSWLAWLVFVTNANRAGASEPDNGSVPAGMPKAMALLADGQWTLEKLSVGPELGEFPVAVKMGNKAVSMHIRADGTRSLKMQLKVVNKFLFKATVSSAPVLHPFQGLRVSQGPGTKMMGPSGMMEVERAISMAFMSVNKWLVRQDTLLLMGPTAELSFRRDAAKTEPVSLSARDKLFAKLSEIRTLKAKLQREGVPSTTVAQQLAPLIEELKELKKQAGHARFEDVAPMKMPTKTPGVLLLL